MFQLSKRSKQRREGVNSKLIEIDDRAIQITLIDYGHPADAGVRLAKRQYELFLDKKSACDGYDKISEHQLGNALDFYAFVDGRASWEYHHLTIIACAYFQAASEFGYSIKWGGLWKRKVPRYTNGIPYGWDAPHIQLVGE